MICQNLQTSTQYETTLKYLSKTNKKNAMRKKVDLLSLLNYFLITRSRVRYGLIKFQFESNEHINQNKKLI